MVPETASLDSGFSVGFPCLHLVPLSLIVLCEFPIILILTVCLCQVGFACVVAHFITLGRQSLAKGARLLAILPVKGNALKLFVRGERVGKKRLSEESQ